MREKMFFSCSLLIFVGISTVSSTVSSTDSLLVSFRGEGIFFLYKYSVRHKSDKEINF